METMTRNERLIWAGAAVSARAHFKVDDEGTPTMTLVASQPDVLRVTARALKLTQEEPQEHDPKGWEIVVEGDELHEVMSEVWPYLLNATRRKYKTVRSLAQAQGVEDQSGSGGEEDQLEPDEE